MLENEANQASWLERGAAGRPRFHSAQWADDTHHGWHILLTGEEAGYYESFSDKPAAHLARSLAEGFAYQGEPFKTLDDHPRGEPSGHLPPSAFVTFLQNHDQVGNRALGERLSHLAEPDRLALARAACCSARRSRCCGWARNGRPRRRSCSSSISLPTRS